MPNIRDVAKRAEVAPITVSRVINHSGNVSAKTRERVEQAIRELGYMPNRLARSLRLKRTHTLALVVTDITNPFWTTVVRGVEDAAQDAGYSVILCNTDESEAKQEQYLDVLMQKQVDGILLVPARTDAEIVAWLEKQHTPIVILDRRVSPAQVDVVRGDSQDGAYQLIRHLLALGHRRIAVLSGPQDVSTAADRVEGYRQALTEAGLDIRADWVQHGRFSQQSGYEMTRQLLATSPRPTALFAVNNFIAIGAQRALQDSGLRVPQDMSVVAIDDLTAELVIEPFLTVADQPAYDMGRRAAELLVARLSGSAPDAYQEIVLPVEITIRGSSGRPAYVAERPSPAPAIVS
ncbi:MAG: LacI family DNA-binding transcriptional regulator [Anaerolineae bacterium]|nr:LacI family DNA-binding transcriptional regulator [Anaerolineae bacterium]